MTRSSLRKPRRRTVAPNRNAIAAAARVLCFAGLASLFASACAHGQSFDLSGEVIAPGDPSRSEPQAHTIERSPHIAGAWPQGNTSLALTIPPVPANFGKRRVYLDPGHGAPGNHGNTGAYCQPEETFTLALAHDVAAVMRKLEGFEVKVARTAEQQPSYEQRVAAATAWNADVYISLHSDVRGPEGTWSPTPGTACRYHDDSPGFSVLWSDTLPGAAPSLTQQRLALARTAAERLADRGFEPCDCWQYQGSYDDDPDVPALFVDRRAQRIYVLRATTMPAIIIETHNALDRLEVRRWNEDHTRQAFALALADTLYRALSRDPDR